MKNQILQSLENPEALERLYRSDKSTFKKHFTDLYPEISEQPLAGYWQARLHFPGGEINWGSARDVGFIVFLAILAGLVAKIPAIFSISEDFFYPRNSGLIVFPFLTAYFSAKNGLSVSYRIFLIFSTIIGAVFINALPDLKSSDTLLLSCVHFLLVLWALLGLAFIGQKKNSLDGRLEFLQYNGDLIVMTTLIGIAGGLLSAVTVGLFSIIGIQIEAFYFQYVGVFGLSAAPLIATYLIRTNPSLVGKVSPVIARIFSPLVLAMLVTYLGAMIYLDKNPYTDREFLLIFNGLLIGVLALVFFSVAEATKSGTSGTQLWILFFLTLVTIIVNGVALSAICFRILEGGITPNRAAVFGSNVLILIHLLLVSFQIYKVLRNQTPLQQVGIRIVSYLPVYLVWVLVVTFLFPFFFDFS